MYLSSLQLHNFRNYAGLDISFQAAGAFFCGDNGAGKSSLLEAIYFLSVGRSPRGASKTDMIRQGGDEAYLAGGYRSVRDAKCRSLSVGFSRDKKIIMKRDGLRVSRLSELLFTSTVVAFGPQDIMLVYGEPSERRRFIDTILCQAAAGYLDHLVRYKKNLLQRNRLLGAGGTDGAIDLYEEQMARDGALIFRDRMTLFECIAAHLDEDYEAIARNGNRGSLRYKPFIHIGGNGDASVAELFLGRLRQERQRDAALGYTSIGPHRDDFLCCINDRPVKTFGSQGECRIMALCLRLASLRYFERERPGATILLVDDAFADLDRGKRNNVAPLIRGRGQLFITTHSLDERLFGDLPGFVISNNTAAAL